jgi:hypothetical protein
MEFTRGLAHTRNLPVFDLAFRYCCHNNLVSHAVLRENYFLTLTTPTNGYETLLEAVKGRGYFLKLFTTAGEFYSMFLAIHG